MNAPLHAGQRAPAADLPTLRFITCGSVDDGKSTLIGRLLLDSQAVLRDQLAGITRQGEPDLARLTDGLSAEREQGITIDVAWRYLRTPRRKFIIGDTPGHEQYTRNMVTAASTADAAVLLVDATKLLAPTSKPSTPAASTFPSASASASTSTVDLLPQTRRHALLAKLLGVGALVFAVNKLDLFEDAAGAFGRIAQALQTFARDAGLVLAGIVPISARAGWNVVDRHPEQPHWCGWTGPTLLGLLESLTPHAQEAASQPFALPVQWVEVSPDAATTPGALRGRRILWGRIAAGEVRVGDELQVSPGVRRARVAAVLDAVRRDMPAGGAIGEGASVGLVLDRELDVSRGDWLEAAPADAHGQVQDELQATLAWLDDQPLAPGRTYLALHGHRWVKAKVVQIEHRLDIHTLAHAPAAALAANEIGRVTLRLQQPVPVRPYATSRSQGAMILVDSASHRTAAALMAA